MRFRTHVIAALAIAFSGSVQANLIVNGSFEDPALSGTNWAVFQSITGWESDASDPGIEIQRNTIISAYDGEQYVELDSYSNSAMSQVISGLSIGSNYALSFAYAPRVDEDFGSPLAINTNGINVYFGGNQELFNLDGLFTTNDAGWSVYSTNVMATAESMVIRFEADGSSDSYGGFIDNVVFESVPTPATLALFGLGLLGMGAVARRRKQS